MLKTDLFAQRRALSNKLAQKAPSVLELVRNWHAIVKSILSHTPEARCSRGRELVYQDLTASDQFSKPLHTQAISFFLKGTETE